MLEGITDAIRSFIDWIRRVAGEWLFVGALAIVIILVIVFYAGGHKKVGIAKGLVGR